MHQRRYDTDIGADFNGKSRPATVTDGHGAASHVPVRARQAAAVTGFLVTFKTQFKLAPASLTSPERSDRDRRLRPGVTNRGPAA
jgi:hypothetical protein